MSNKPQYLEDPKPTDVAACNWQQGQRFRVMKMDLFDLHSAWYVVMPGGACLTFNNCADDAQDEAHANWIAATLNTALASQASTASEPPKCLTCNGQGLLGSAARFEDGGVECHECMGTGKSQAASEPAALGEGERAELDRLRALVNSPETRDFLTGVRNEVAHQVERWGTVHDRAKEPQDWFWLLGYLGGKALKAHADGDTDKALHHCISSAAVLANWHLHIKIGAGLMQPGSSDLQDFIRQTFGANFIEAQGGSA